MHQLSGLDTTFLNIETATTYGHIAGLAVFDPSRAVVPVDFALLRDLVESRLHLVPPYRRRLIEVPFGLDQPYWIEDPGFDLDFHLRHLGLPAPGTKEQLAEQVASIVSRPLDRNRPLWELYMIEGLEGGLIAHVSKIHHSAIDGVSGAELLATMLDLEPTPRVVDPPEPPWKSEPVPTESAMLTRGLLAMSNRPAKGIELWLKTLTELPAIAKQFGIGLPSIAKAASDAPPFLSEALTSPPQTSFNGRIGAHRRYAYASLPLDDFKMIKSAFGVTLNDVIMAVCAGALRNYLLSGDELPDDPLIAMIPVSIRTEDHAGTQGNQIASMTAPIHTQIADPIERLDLIHQSMRVAKEQHKAIPAELQQDWAQFAPPSVAARAARTITRAAGDGRVNLPYNVVISNVPGPQFPLYGIGAELLANYPVSTIHDGAGLNITAQSYNGHLDFGLLACRDLVPDVWGILGLIEAEVGVLLELAGSGKAAPPAKKTPANKDL